MLSMTIVDTKWSFRKAFIFLKNGAGGSFDLMFGAMREQIRHNTENPENFVLQF